MKRLWGTFLVFLAASLLPAVCGAAEVVGRVAEKAESHGGLPLSAPPLFKIGPIPVSDSMLVTWIVALLLILSAQIATRRMKEVPSGFQNFWEWLVESLHEFLESILGPALTKKTFWFFATIFVFILATNWFGLIPGVGTVGWGEPVKEGGFMLKEVSTPLLRGGNADLNMTLAMSMIFFMLWTVWAVQAQGVGGVIKHTFGPKGDSKGAMRIAMIFIFLAVGFLEVISILVRPISLSLRLFGNVYAGESILEVMGNMMHGGWAWLNYVLPVPFYFMELLVGVVQALVFMLLTAVFTLLICQHDEESGAAHH